MHARARARASTPMFRFCHSRALHRSPERGIYTSMSCHGPSPILVTAPTRKHCCGRDQFQNPTASCKEPNFVKQVEIIIADPPSRFTHGTFPCVVILTKKEKEKTKFGITLSALPCSCFTSKTNRPFIHVVHLISWILQRESKTSTLRSPSSDVGFQQQQQILELNWFLSTEIRRFFLPRRNNCHHSVKACLFLITRMRTLEAYFKQEPSSSAKNISSSVSCWRHCVVA